MAYLELRLDTTALVETFLLVGVLAVARLRPDLSTELLLTLACRSYFRGAGLQIVRQYRV